MMPAKRTEYSPPAGDHGLIFDWQARRTPYLGKLGLLALTAGLFLLLSIVVRVKVGTLPVQDHRSASIIMLTPGSDPMHWIEAARDLGPFPTRFEPADWPQVRSQIADVLQTTDQAALPTLAPQFAQLPDHEAVAPIPLIAKGSRILPSVPPPPDRPMPRVPMRLSPVIFSLTAGDGALPATNPPFDATITPDMASQPWRFLLQIAPDGEVIHATALIGHNVPGRPELSRWLEAHRFPAHRASTDRWVAIAITFQNQPDHGADDP
jgi:hypothetical protein